MTQTCSSVGDPASFLPCSPTRAFQRGESVDAAINQRERTGYVFWLVVARLPLFGGWMLRPRPTLVLEVDKLPS